MSSVRFRVPVLVAALSLPFLGCEDSGSGGGSGQWNEPPKPTTTTRPAAAPQATTTTQPAAVAPATTRPAAAPATTQPAAAAAASQPATKALDPAAASGGAVGADQISFGALNWTYGGKPKAAGARNGGVVISGARFSRGGMSFSYVKDLSAWGYSRDALGGVACLFVRKENGQWVGGKFDWISSSRNSRDFNNVYAGYSGWSLADVPNPCQAAFVIVSSDGKRRSNTILGTWSR